MKDIELHLAKVIKDHRARLGISQEVFAHRAGIHRTYASSIERGQVQISIVIAAKVAEALEIKLSRLFRDVEEVADDSKG
jgi:transcriptional regulator with XRE-family HTH domain